MVRADLTIREEIIDIIEKKTNDYENICAGRNTCWHLFLF